jgi:hypothetical protein
MKLLEYYIPSTHIWTPRLLAVKPFSASSNIKGNCYRACHCFMDRFCIIKISSVASQQSKQILEIYSLYRLSKVGKIKKNSWRQMRRGDNPHLRESTNKVKPGRIETSSLTLINAHLRRVKLKTPNKADINNQTAEGKGIEETLALEELLTDK